MNLTNNKKAKVKENAEKYVQYVSRDYSLRDHDITIDALATPKIVPQIVYHHVRDIRRNNVLEIYVIPSDQKLINDTLEESLIHKPELIDFYLKEGTRVTNNLLKMTKFDLSKITPSKSEAFALLKKAKIAWDEFGSFIEFTHRIGHINKIKLPEKQLLQLGKFHDERKIIFVSFFEYLDRICEKIAANTAIENKKLRFLTYKEILSFEQREFDIKWINYHQNLREKNYIYEVNNGNSKIIDENFEEEFKKTMTRISAPTVSLEGKSAYEDIVRANAIVLTQAQFKNIKKKMFLVRFW